MTHQLTLTVFLAGLTTLAVEFIASRLMQTVYGSSNLVWANVIGLVLLALSAGYYLGGRWADRAPRPDLFYALVCLAAYAATAGLLLAGWWVRPAAAALATANISATGSALLAAAFILALPVTLLGAITPFALRLAMSDIGRAGRVSGRLYAVSTYGSLAGTYLPILVAIPLAGMRWSSLIFGLPLYLAGWWGAWRCGARWARWLWIPLLSLGLLAWVAVRGPLKATPGLILAAESAYNYIEVVADGPCRYLLLNEGAGWHSVRCSDGEVAPQWVWGLLAAAPFYDPAPHVDRVAIIGLAGGTTARLYHQVWPAARLDGFELDPTIVEIGRTYFDLATPGLTVWVDDGRYGLGQQAALYDVIVVDAYRVPYIPWHLTTQEFFAEARAHLTAHGALTMNVGRTPADRRLVEALTATLLTVFPSVHTIDAPGSLNTILTATVQPTQADTLQAALTATTEPWLQAMLTAAVANSRPTQASTLVFRDDRAPVETLVDALVVRYLATTGLGGLFGRVGPQ